MFKETISPNQATKLLIVHIIGSATLFIMGLEAKMDIWIAILVAIAVSTLLYCVYAKILSIIPQSDFYMTLEKLLGRPITIVFVLILTWFVFDFGAAVLTNYNNFVFTVGLPETPRIIISLSMMLMCAIAVKAGTETLGRLSQLFIVIIVGFILLVTPLMIGNADFSNIKPVFHNGIKPIFKGALGVITFPFDNIMVFLLVFPAFKKKTKIKKIYLTALYIAGGLLLITSTLNVLVLSPTYAENVTFPTYVVLSIVKVGKFLNRLEVVAAAVFCMAVFFKISILLLGVCKGLAYIFKADDYRNFTYPIALLMLNFSYLSFTSVYQYQEWSFKVWPYYSAIFSVIIPSILLILLEFRYHALCKKGKIAVYKK